MGLQMSETTNPQDLYTESAKTQAVEKWNQASRFDLENGLFEIFDRHLRYFLWLNGYDADFHSLPPSPYMSFKAKRLPGHFVKGKKGLTKTGVIEYIKDGGDILVETLTAYLSTEDLLEQPLHPYGHIDIRKRLGVPPSQQKEFEPMIDTAIVWTFYEKYLKTKDKRWLKVALRTYKDSGYLNHGIMS